jgi:hypothetical protein
MTDGSDDASGTEGNRAGGRGNATMNSYLSRIAVTMTEMEQGRRPVSTLDPVASPMAARRIRVLVENARTGRVARTGRTPRTAPTSVLNTISSHPTAGVTEGVVILECEQRVRAICVRLEQSGGRWRIVELAPPDGGLAAAVTMASRLGGMPADDDDAATGRTDD